MKQFLLVLSGIIAVAISNAALAEEVLDGPALGSPWEANAPAAVSPSDSEKLVSPWKPDEDREPAILPTNETASAAQTPLASAFRSKPSDNVRSNDAQATETRTAPPAEMPASDQAATPLVLAKSVGERSVQLEQIARQADSLTRHGYELAGRRAYFAARAEFLAALTLVADGLDTEQGVTAHGRALAAALTALREAEDFLPSATRPLGSRNLADVIAVHETPVLKDHAGDLTTMTALKCYLTFAQQQFAEAAGREVAGSMALHGLGKLHAALIRSKSDLAPVAAPKAMVFYQAAMLVYPGNFMAANDLGVLLAQNGDFQSSQRMLEQSIAQRPLSSTWRNLAVVYRQNGDPLAADQALQQTALLEQAEIARRRQATGSAISTVQWLDPQEFSKTSLNTPSSPGSAAPGAKPAAGRTAQTSSVPFDAYGRSPIRLALACTSDQALIDKWAVPIDCDQSPRLALRCPEQRREIVLCQALGPAAPCNICGVDCSTCNCRRCGGWEAMRAIQWQAYAQGEYVGHARTAHVPEYRLRVDDQLDMIYRLTRDETTTPYRLNVGDTIQVESFTDPDVNRELLIQPDGTITLRLLGQVHATGRTVTQLRDALDEAYKKYYKVPAITVTPLKVNTKLEDLRATIDRRAGIGGQSQAVRITPEGTIALPAIGSVQAQGLTLGELQRELNECYGQVVEGIQVIPMLMQRAPRYVYVLGEVANPGRYELTGPTTAIQSISMAGSWRVGANLRQIVVFRRGDDWRLLATMINLEGALQGRTPCPKGEIWIDDSDVVIVPKSRILQADDFIELVFTRGIYGVLPMNATLQFSKLSSL